MTQILEQPDIVTWLTRTGWQGTNVWTQKHTSFREREREREERERAETERDTDTSCFPLAVAVSVCLSRTQKMCVSIVAFIKDGESESEELRYTLSLQQQIKIIIIKALASQSPFVVTGPSDEKAISRSRFFLFLALFPHALSYFLFLAHAFCCLNLLLNFLDH